MRKIIAILGGPVVGMDAYDALLVDNTATDDEINNIVYGMCVEHYDSYGYEAGPGGGYAAEFGDDLEIEYDFSWEDYDPEKHDMHRTGGGSFQDEFDRMSARNTS